jgi:hypothetical protein
MAQLALQVPPEFKDLLVQQEQQDQLVMELVRSLTMEMEH